MKRLENSGSNSPPQPGKVQILHLYSPDESRDDKLKKICFVFAFLSHEELRAFFLSNSEWRIQFLFSLWSISCIPPKLYFHRLDKERGLISQTVDGNRALNLSLIWTIKGCKLRSISLKYINFKVFTIAFFAFLSSASRIHVESFLQYLALYPRTFSFVIPFLWCFCL